MVFNITVSSVPLKHKLYKFKILNIRIGLNMFICLLLIILILVIFTYMLRVTIEYISFIHTGAKIESKTSQDCQRYWDDILHPAGPSPEPRGRPTYPASWLHHKTLLWSIPVGSWSNMVTLGILQINVSYMLNR